MIETLNVDSFSKFGIYIQKPNQISSDAGEYHKYWHATNMNFFEGEKLTMGCLSINSHESVVKELERHLTCSEVFITIKGSGILVAADPIEFENTWDKKQVLHYFKLEPGDAVLIRKGIWHKLPVPSGEHIDFLMLVPERILNDINKTELNCPVHF